MHYVDVFLTGKLLAGVELAAAAADLAALARIKHSVAHTLLNSGRPVLIKRKVTRELGERYAQRLSGIGLEVLLQPTSTARALGSEHKQPKILPQPATQPIVSDPSLAPSANEAANEAANKSISSPTLPSPKPHTATQSSESHIQAPIAPASQPMSPASDSRDEAMAYRGYTWFPNKSAEVNEESMFSAPTRIWLSGSRVVPTSHGWGWIRQALTLFAQYPFKWLGLSAMIVLGFGFTLLVPLAGYLSLSLFLPMILGALMPLAHSQYQDDPFTIIWFARGRLYWWGRLFVVGFLSLLFFLFLGTAFFFLQGQGFFGKIEPSHIWSQLLQRREFFIFMGTSVVLSLPLFLGYWFAIPLVAIVRERPLRAYQRGFGASVKNWQAIFVAMASFAACQLLGGVLIGAFLFIVSSFFTQFSSFLFLSLLLAVALFNIAIVVLTMYTSFRDIFVIEP